MRINPFSLGRRNLLNHPFSVFSKVALFLGVFLFSLGIFLFMLIGVAQGNIEEGRVVLFSVSIQGVVWGVISVVFLCIVNSGAKRLRDLKQHGRQFEAEIISLIPVVGINVGFRTPTVYAECIYLNENQQRCKIKSRMFLWINFAHDELQATVYVDWNDPHNYAVEIAQREFNHSQVDIDYT